MRLTLRTLLAFMDDILDPVERDQLTKKITESDYAKGLMERVSRLMRNSHMSAPSPGPSNQKLDANHIACYLDNTLTPEQVSSVEKVCFESDVHLAETAACHQILAQVLSEAVEIPGETRQRIYELIPDGPEREKDSRKTGVRDEGILIPELDIEEDLPFSSESGRGSWGWMLPTACVVVMIILITSILFIRNSTNVPVAIGKGHSGANVVPPRDQQAALQVEQSQEQDTVLDGTEWGGVPELDLDEDGGLTGYEEGNNEPIVELEPIIELEPAIEQEPIINFDPQSDERGVSSETVPGASGVLSDVDEESSPVNRQGFTTGMIGSRTDEIVLVRRNRASQWKRPTGEGDLLYAGDRLVALPYFRPRTNWMEGKLTLELVGSSSDAVYGAEVVVMPGSDNQVSGILLMAGQVSISAQEAPLTIRVCFGENPEGGWELEFLEPGTRIGLELKLELPIQSENRSRATWLQMAYVKSGSLVVRNKVGSQTLVAPVIVELKEDESIPEVPYETTDIPPWVTRKAMGALERRAAEILEVPMETDGNTARPIELSLIEQMQDRRSEVQILAMRSLVSLREYDALLRVLDTAQADREEVVRIEAIKALRYALAHGPSQENIIRNLLVDHRGQEEGALRYQLLSGINKAMKANPDMVPWLIDLLFHDELGTRELARFNLSEVIKRPLESYHAHDPVKKRSRSAQSMRRLQKQGKLLPKKVRNNPEN